MVPAMKREGDMAPGRGRIHRFSVFLLTLVLAGGDVAANDGVREREWRHVQDVLFGARDESTWRGRRITRWETAPVLMLFGARPEDRAFVETAVEKINHGMGGLALRIEANDPAAATVGMFFAPLRDMRAIATAYGMRADLAMRGVGYTEVDVTARHGLHFAIVLVRDELAGRERRATIIHELYHALGPGGHSSWIPASVVFAGHGLSSFATAPAPVDIKALALLYRHLRPGDGEDAARAAFDAHWSELDAVVGAAYGGE